MKSADEFYSIMDVLTREIFEFGPTDTNKLIMAICNIVPFPFPYLNKLRENYYYNISPFNAGISQVKNGFRNMSNNLDGTDDNGSNWLEEQILMIHWHLNNTPGNFINKKSLLNSKQF